MFLRRRIVGNDITNELLGLLEFAEIHLLLGLQRAGYATDPAYADKLGRLINTTLRMQKVIS